MSEEETFLRLVLEEFRADYEDLWSNFVEEQLQPTPGWKGFTGVLAFADETERYSPYWTPKEFDRMWDEMSDKEKIKYVKSLLREKR